MAERPGTFDGVHRRNLSKLLRIVHREGPLSRARLTEQTGLNRSTVAALAAELVELGLVEERAPDPTNRVGRPSPVIAVHPTVVAIAVNPEIDAVTIAAVGLDRRVVVRDRVEVDRLVTPEETAGLVAETIMRWRRGPLRGARVVSIGLAVPGLVRASDGLVRLAPHLGWREAPVRVLVEEATGILTIVGNDASHGATAEHLFGAGMGVEDLVYLNGGASGIGGGVIVHGLLLGGAGGYAGEFGQNRPGIAAAADRRAAGGVLEDEVSRSRLLDALHLKHADEPTLARAIEESDASAVHDEVARQRRILATALANAVNVLNPSVVILGGFLATIAERDRDGLAAAVEAQSMPAAFELVELRTAALGEDRLMIGAAEAAFADLLDDPGRAVAG
ncbi:ROK family transcriptional regulator [Agromyces protaetiae]|uniref:ROK family transcriptional regulator n=1 Tax=Agromyces protaetiae TaxID=2509455 RepID=UPI001FB79A21|nr:ROK family transcriptional regulator [Agromyces protaetiae]